MKTTAIPDFSWPEFKNDRERIKIYSLKYKDMPIAQAFNEVYNANISVKEEADIIPVDLKKHHVGQVIPVRISRISKNLVEFDSLSFKTSVTTNANLYKYEKFRHVLPLDTISARIVDVSKDKVSVDIMTPMIEEYIEPYANAPWKQKDMTQPAAILIKNLQLTRGGFTGQAVIPNVSEWVGEEYTVPAFIPGSQIVLNIAENFEEFVGKDVWAFIANYSGSSKRDSKMSLICSAKEYFKYMGEATMIDVYKHYCEDDDYWKAVSTQAWNGRVTGVINSSKKCGVFVEIPELNITGMVPCKPEEIVNYKPNSSVAVKWAGFEELTYFNEYVQQQQHIEPYVITDNKIEKCNLKCTLEFV